MLSRGSLFFISSGRQTCFTKLLLRTVSTGSKSRIAFPPHDPNVPFDFPKEETNVLQYWRDIDAFKESLKQSEGKPLFSFYDGPPFATGLPHYGHLLMGTIKDIVTRFAHANGYHVERRFGWDTHGLPVEREIDKKLNIQTKEDVMKLGIDRYNAECRAIVMRYSAEWRATVERMGRWIDFDNDYKTLNTTFMETVWWVFKQLWDKGSVYQGLRVMPYSMACTTPLSNFEAALDYRDVIDPAVTVAFELVDSPENAAVLAWTTTPWTLPSNLALCVHPNFVYLKIRDKEKNRVFYINENLLRTLYKDPKKAKFKKLGTVKGKEMQGWRYKPLYPFFVEKFGDRAFKIICDTYVTSESGTGIVHQAPAFGDDDHRIAVREGIVRDDELPPLPLDERGNFTDQVKYLEDGSESGFSGLNVKDADKIIQRQLKERGSLVVQSSSTHSYPFCWRSGTPLIYRAMSCWFVRVENMRDRLIKNNNATRWVPAEVGEKRFTSWLANARDWNISRNRYWGTPLPIWRSDDGEETICVGSIEELAKLSGCGQLTDLHRESIDDITIPSKMGKGRLRRVEEVFDCWFESGSMPFAQNHYPFENQQKTEQAFPADFVSEAMDQTRGWFYTLLVVATHLFDKAPWKNLIISGLVLAEDGKKMSKSLKNYPDPNLILNQYGADALRLFLINSPVVRGDNLRFREAGVKEVISRVLLPWLNSFRFFLGSTALLTKESGIEFKYDGKAARSSNVMDRWILAKCQSLIAQVDQEMKAYRLYTVVPRLLDSIDQLTNWYIRFNRRRLKGENGIEDTQAALTCLFEALLTLSRVMAPFAPFMAEHLFQALKTFFSPRSLSSSLGEDLRSIHFLPFPMLQKDLLDTDIERRVLRMQQVILLARSVREANKVAFKIPLQEMMVSHRSQEYLADVASLEDYIRAECNIESIRYESETKFAGIHWFLQPNMKRLGQKFGRDTPKIVRELAALGQPDLQRLNEEGQITLFSRRHVEIDDVSLSVNAEDSATAYDINEGLTVRLEMAISKARQASGHARQLANEIQKARKRAGLDSSALLQAVLSTSSDSDRDWFATVLQSNGDLVSSILRVRPRLEAILGDADTETITIDDRTVHIRFDSQDD